LHEGLPTVLVEALALGTPVISTDCGSGPRELLDDGRLGRLVGVNDVPALTEAMLDSLANREAAAPARHSVSEAILPYTSQYAAQAYYQVWNR
jgi:glycosyltransferase involved in cell wall biosynthesis